ncbi:MAG: ATP synthase F0 subunit B [Deltaproteobacteria bacterium]|nr:ATP synthase F0 subunit B [Deltaproteobacteria bacterium]
MIDLNMTMLIQWGIYIALMIFLHFFLFKPVLRVIDARQAKIEGTMAGAEELQEKAAENRQNYESKISAAKERIFARTAAIRESAAKEAKEFMDKAREEAMAQVEATKERIKRDSEVVRKELRGSINVLARDIAVKILEREI